MALDAHQALVPTDAFGATLELIFGPGHNAVRLSLVALTTLVMAITVARGRRTLLEAVVAAWLATKVAGWMLGMNMVIVPGKKDTRTISVPSRNLSV